MSEPRQKKHPKTLVVKVGTSLIDSETHHFNRRVVGDIAAGIVRQMKRGTVVVLVSSGAVGAGIRRLGWKRETRSVVDRQALAAVGQPYLMRFYKEVFGEHDVIVAQVLLTRLGLEDRQRYLNARHTLDRLASLSILPIVNENDTVVTEELQFGDNDRLAAVVAGKIRSDLLILLTDVEAVLDENQQPVRRVTQVSPSLLKAARGPASSRSRGGMKAKLKAVQEAMLMGTTAAITSGQIPGIVDRIVEAYPRMMDLECEPDPEVPGSWFIGQERGLVGRKRWILSCQSTQGAILVDEGARNALERGNRSLLPSGVVGVEGKFEAGETVSIASAEKDVFGQGLANLSSSELLRVMGKSTREAKEAIGRDVKGCVAVHRDDLVLLQESPRGIAI